MKGSLAILSLVLVVAGATYAGRTRAEDRATKSAERLSKDEYVARMRAIHRALEDRAARGQDELIGSDPPRAGDACVRKARDVHGAFATAVAEIERVRPPKEVETLHRRLLAAARHFSRDIGKAATDVQQGRLACGEPFAERVYSLASIRRLHEVHAEFQARGYDFVGEEDPNAMDLDDAREFDEFSLYFVGESFEGLRLTAIERRKDDPHPDEPIAANWVDFIYGTCTVEPGFDTGGCAPPLQIQIWPACRRSLADYELAPGRPFPHEKGGVRGTAAAEFPRDRVEVYAGDATIVIFADDTDLAWRAADALEGVNVPVERGDDLPDPVSGALEGTREC